MPCYRPNPALQRFSSSTNKWLKPKIYYPTSVNDDKSRVFPSFKRSQSEILVTQSGFRSGDEWKLTTLPCGKCFGCRCDNSREWALRIMHERRYHSHNYFITLTYAPEHLPRFSDLNYDDLQKFFYKARHEFQEKNFPFKYFACGEYGDVNLRPHYHFCAFDFKIDDLRPYTKVQGHWYYLSDTLRDCWGKGHVVIGSLDWDSASYVPRYVTKKMHGQTLRYMDAYDPDTGEVYPYTVERGFQSKGLGKDWYLDHEDEVWNQDAVLFKGEYQIKPPRYYFKQLQKSDPDRALFIKESRLAKIDLEIIDTAKDRQLLYTMEAKKLQMQTLIRDL